MVGAAAPPRSSGSGTARDGNKLDLKRWGSDGINNLTPLWLLKYLPNMLACHVTIIHELKGPSNTITCADASSHLAIGEAFRTIQRGNADLAICGGAESKVNPMGLVRQTLLKRVTTHNDSPESAVRPFDDRRGLLNRLDGTRRRLDPDAPAGKPHAQGEVEVLVVHEEALGEAAAETCDEIRTSADEQSCAGVAAGGEELDFEAEGGRALGGAAEDFFEEGAGVEREFALGGR